MHPLLFYLIFICNKNGPDEKTVSTCNYMKHGICIQLSCGLPHATCIFDGFFCLEVFEAPKRLSLPDQAKAVIAKFCSGMATLPHVSNPFFVRKFEGLAKVTARPAPSKNAGCSCQRH